MVVAIRYQVQRLEKRVYPAETSDLRKYLDSENLVPVNETFRDIAEEVVEGKTGDLVRARALYDHVIDRMRYMKFGSGWGKGDAVYACNVRTGNCTDFHSYFIALATSVGIPAPGKTRPQSPPLPFFSRPKPTAPCSHAIARSNHWAAWERRCGMRCPSYAKHLPSSGFAHH